MFIHRFGALLLAGIAAAACAPTALAAQQPAPARAQAPAQAHSCPMHANASPNASAAGHAHHHAAAGDTSHAAHHPQHAAGSSHAMQGANHANHSMTGASAHAGHQAHAGATASAGEHSCCGDRASCECCKSREACEKCCQTMMNGGAHTGPPSHPATTPKGMGHGAHHPAAAPVGHAPGHAANDATQPVGGHAMWMRPLGGGWSVMGMAQAFPIVTAGMAGDDSPLSETEVYLTQPAAMLNLESPGQRLVLRTTLNFEALTQEDGELTLGGWGEGFIDRRHPHTLLHEAMLSLNLWNAGPGSFSLSAGKGFAPYGTDDPMSRPVAKYPTNHHLSQILERWTLNAAYTLPGWSLEAGLFGGQEPDGPYDFSNVESFGDSYSARVTRHFGPRSGMSSPWELSASWGSIAEAHHGEKERTTLLNAALRHDAAYGAGRLYALAEASRSDPEGEEEGYYSLLGEALWTAGRHQPYARVEYATRPEYEREGVSGKPFFRYHHDDDAIGATRWLIGSLGYAYRLTGYPFAAAPFVEVQHNRVWEERGGVSPGALFGRDTSWSLTAGARIYLGSGGPMRMGTYGVRDEMTTMHRGMGGHTMNSTPSQGHGH